MVITCGPAQVAVEYGMSAGGFFIASWCGAHIVEVLVGSSTVGASGSLVAGHAYIYCMSELNVVLPDRVLVIEVHAFCFAGPIVNSPGSFFSWDAAGDCEGRLCVESGNYCYEGAFRLTVFPMFPVAEEVDAGKRCCYIGCNLFTQVL